MLEDVIKWEPIKKTNLFLWGGLGPWVWGQRKIAKFYFSLGGSSHTLWFMSLLYYGFSQNCQPAIYQYEKKKQKKGLKILLDLIKHFCQFLLLCTEEPKQETCLRPQDFLKRVNKNQSKDNCWVLRKSSLRPAMFLWVCSWNGPERERFNSVVNLVLLPTTISSVSWLQEVEECAEQRYVNTIPSVKVLLP